jgi:cold shock CspA family protein
MNSPAARQFGTVRHFDARNGYGFIRNDQGKRVFLHNSQIAGVPKVGARVEYEVAPDCYGRGLRALDVHVIER